MILTVLLGVLVIVQEPATKPQIENYKLDFIGLDMLSERELLRAAVDEEADLVKNGYRRAEVDDMAFQMEMRAHALGYPFARVRWQSEVRDAVLHATFEVNEGPYCTLAGVTVTGSTIFPQEELARFCYRSDETITDDKPAFVQARVNGAPGSIANLYRAQGYRDVQVGAAEVRFSEDRIQAFVEIQLTEGPRYLIRQITLEGNEVVDEATLLQLSSELIGAPFFPRRAFEVKQGIEDYYADLGYPMSSVTMTRDLNTETGEVKLHAALQEGMHVRIGEIRVSGQERTRPNFIRNRLELSAGDESDRTLEEESFRNLYRTGLFSRVQIGLATEETSPGVRDLLVEVEEGYHREVIIEPGYGSYEKLRLLLGWRHKNIFGTGRILRTEVRPSMKSFNALVGFTDPWLLESDIELDAPVFYRKRQEPSFTREEAGLALQFRYPFTSDLSLLWGYRITRSKVYSESVGAPDDIVLGDTTLGAIFGGPRWDTQNDHFNPTRGGKYWIQVGYGAEELASEVEFVGGEVKASHHWPLNDAESTVLAASYRSGFVVPVGVTDEIPLQLRLFNGGENSVRAFEESRLGPFDSSGAPIGGEVFNTANIELRQGLSRAMWLALFADFGNVSLSTSDWFEDIREGYGVGMRYLLPVGALRLDLGFNPNTRRNESDWVLHLSVGMAF